MGRDGAVRETEESPLPKARCDEQTLHQRPSQSQLQSLSLHGNCSLVIMMISAMVANNSDQTQRPAESVSD